MTKHDAYDFHADQLPSDTLAKIDDFWGWFSEKSEALDAYFTTQGDAAETDPFEVMDRLNEHWPDIMWEFGPSERGHKVVITAEWQDENRPLARALLRRAPEFERWEVAETREASDLEQLVPAFEGRFQEQFQLSDIEAEVAVNGRIDLNVTGGADEGTLIEQGIKVTTLLLGEEGDRDWLGHVTAEPSQTSKGGLLARLRGRKAPDFDPVVSQARLLAAIESSKADLPQKPQHEIPLEDRDATLFQANEMPSDHARSDLITFMAPNERFGRAVLSGNRFSSATHSLHGETFAYLRLPNQNGTPWDTDTRADAEDQIHELLSREALGSHVAAGSGREAAYIDVTFTDVAAGIAKLAQGLRNEPFAQDVTVHFMDPGLTHHAHPLFGGVSTLQ